MAFKDPPAWSPHLPDFHRCTLQDCRLQLPPGVWHVHAPILPHQRWPSGRGKKPLAPPMLPQSASRGDPFRRLVRSLSLRPSWLLASWADQTENTGAPALPQACTSGLPALKSPRELPDMTTAPNGELRRQDLHLQVQQLVSLRPLQWPARHTPQDTLMIPALRASTDGTRGRPHRGWGVCTRTLRQRPAGRRLRKPGIAMAVRPASNGAYLVRHARSAAPHPPTRATPTLLPPTASSARASVTGWDRCGDI